MVNKTTMKDTWTCMPAHPFHRVKFHRILFTWGQDFLGNDTASWSGRALKSVQPVKRVQYTSSTLRDATLSSKQASKYFKWFLDDFVTEHLLKKSWISSHFSFTFVNILYCVYFSPPLTYFVFFLYRRKSSLPRIAYSAYLIRAWSPPRSSSAACAATSIHAATGYRGSSTATTPSAPLVWRECPSWRVPSTPSPALSVVGLPAPEPAWLCQGLCGSTQKSGTRFPRSEIRMRTIQWRI